MRQKFFKNKSLWLIIPFLIYLFFGLHHLTKFETADEHLWMYNPREGRIDRYWEAIEKKDWEKTRVNDKPGITLAYIPGIGKFFEGDKDERILERKSSYMIADPEKSEEINFLYRFPLLLFNGLFCFIFYWLIKRITSNDWLAFLSASLILVNPVLLGISQIINPDALLWTFFTGSFLSFLTYIKTREKKFTALASLFLGLALLSKYAATLLLPLFFAIMAFDILRNFKIWEEKKELRKKVAGLIINYFLIILGALIVYSLLLPEVFTDWTLLLKGTIDFKGAQVGQNIFVLPFFICVFFLLDALILKSRLIFYFSKVFSFLGRILPRLLFFSLGAMLLMVLLNWSIGHNFLHITNVPFDASQEDLFINLDLFQKIFLEFRPLVFSLPPVILFLSILTWLKLSFQKKKSPGLIFYISLAMLLFYAAALAQNLLVSIRYNIILYPLIMITAAWGFWDIFQLEKRKLSTNTTAVLLLVFTAVVSLQLSKPFYFNYTNNLLPKDQLITGAWGYGGYEAAEYINSQPNSKYFTVFADYHGTCSFIEGKCVNININKYSKTNGADYYVVSRRGLILNEKSWPEIQRRHPWMKLVWELQIGGRPDNFVQVWKE